MAQKRSFDNKSFIKKAKDKHGNRYDYSKVNYIHSKKPVIIICLEHGEFSQRPNAHLNGSGCPKCGISFGSRKRNYDTSEFIKRAREKHGDRYDYSLTEYSESTDKVLIKCPDHGVFKQRPANHLRGCCCPSCAQKIVDEKRKKQNGDFVKEAAHVHDNKYDYEHCVYSNNKSKVIITCPKHGSFFQSPNAHLQGQGCPRCACIGKSKMEDELADLVLEMLKNAR